MRALSRKIKEREYEIYTQRAILQQNYALLKEYVKTDKFIFLSMVGSVIFGFLFVVRKRTGGIFKKLLVSPLIIKKIYHQLKGFIIPLLA